MTKHFSRATFVAALAAAITLLPVAVLLLNATSAQAAFTPLSPQADVAFGPINPNSAGQGDLPKISGSGNDHEFIDWIVMQYNPIWDATLIANSALTSNGVSHPTTPFAGATSAAYLYLYQVENPSPSTAADRLSITVNNSFILGGGALEKFPTLGPAIVNYADLDVDGGIYGISTILPGVPGHNSGNFPILAGEFEPSGIKTTGYQFDNFDSSGVIGWDFLLPADMETVTLWMVSTAPPVYGVARVQDGGQWNDDHQGEPVPVPDTSVPEPASICVWGLMSLLGCYGYFQRRRIASF